MMVAAGQSARPQVMLPRPLVLIVNHNAGSYPRWKGQLEAALQREDLTILDELDVRETERLARWTAGDPTERPVVVAAGGDGTVGSVASRLVNTGTPLAIVPLGTHNDTARSLGIPAGVDAAVRLLVAGKVASVDAARYVPAVGEPHFFVQAAAVGIQSTFARLATDRSMRRRLGKFTYVVATARAWHQRQPFCCTLLVDDRHLRLSLLCLTVLNAPVFGGSLELHLPGGSMDNRLLDILAVEAMSLPRFLRAMASLARGRTPKDRGVHLLWAPRLRVECSEAREVTLDGEIAGHLPGEFILAPEGLHVVTPWTFEEQYDD